MRKLLAALAGAALLIAAHPATADAATLGPGGATTNPTWAGFVEKGSFTAVGGTWTVPHVHGRRGAMVAQWVGFDGYGESEILQAGVQETVGTQPFLWVATTPKPDEHHLIDVKPGDQVSVEISAREAGWYEVDVRDVTRGKAASRSVSFTRPVDEAEWIVETPMLTRTKEGAFCNPARLAWFGHVDFTSATYAGQSTTETALTMSGPGRRVDWDRASLGVTQRVSRSYRVMGAPGAGSGVSEVACGG